MPARLRVEGELPAGRRPAAAILSIVTSAIFAAPPVAAFRVVAGSIT